MIVRWLLHSVVARLRSRRAVYAAIFWAYKPGPILSGKFAESCADVPQRKQCNDTRHLMIAVLSPARHPRLTNQQSAALLHAALA